MMKHILIVDDDIHIGNLLEEALLQEHYRVSHAYSGTEALMLLEREQPDLVLLDLMLPGLSGKEVLRKISSLPVIIISAKADVDSKVELLLGGAVDYITKPFHLRELLARITVALRSAPASDELLRCGAITLDSSAGTATIHGSSVKLTRTESALLKQLMKRPGQVITKSQLLDAISADTPDCTEGSLKIHISHLRRKLREHLSADPIEAVWGIGFRLMES